MMYRCAVCGKTFDSSEMACYKRNQVDYYFNVCSDCAVNADPDYLSKLSFYKGDVPDGCECCRPK